MGPRIDLLSHVLACTILVIAVTVAALFLVAHT